MRSREIKTGRDVMRARASLGMTMEEFGNLLKVSHAAVSRWESGDRPIVPYMGEYIRLKVADYQAQGAVAATA
jgi:predicted transcriptional regulator